MSGSLDKTLKYWDVSGLLAGGSKQKDVAANGKKDLEKPSPCTMNFVGHTDYVLSVAVSHDGQWVVSGSKDRGVQFWEAHSANVHSYVCTLYLLLPFHHKGTFAPHI